MAARKYFTQNVQIHLCNKQIFFFSTYCTLMLVLIKKNCMTLSYFEAEFMKFNELYYFRKFWIVYFIFSFLSIDCQVCA